MKKKTFFTIILDSVFVVAFNALFYIIGAYNLGTSIWICYGFLHFSYLMLLLTPLIEAKGKTSGISKLTTYSILSVYFLIELLFVISIYFMGFYNPVVIASIQIIVTTVFSVLMVLNLLKNDSIAKKQIEHDIQNNFIKIISTKVQLIESKAVDNSLKNKLNKLYYSMHSSPIKSCAEVSVYELKLQELLADLENLVMKNENLASEKITEIVEILNRRNDLLKMKV